MGGHNVDAFVAIGVVTETCVSMIAIANMNIPAIFAYGGTIAPGNLNSRISTWFLFSKGSGNGTTAIWLLKKWSNWNASNACPGPVVTMVGCIHNTMATAIKVLGWENTWFLFSPCWISWQRPILKVVQLSKCLKWTEAIWYLDSWSLWYDYELTGAGGSTNATLRGHHAANVDMTLEDFNDFQGACLTWRT